MGGSSAQSDPQKTEEAVDRRQNNSYVTAVTDLTIEKQLVYSAVAVSTESQRQCP